MVVSDELVAYCKAEPKVEPALAAPPDSFDRPAFFDEDFGFRSRLEALAPIIRSEWGRIPPAALRLWPEPSAFTGTWATLGLIIAGHRVEGNCRMCPRTAEFLDQLPEVYSAGFSVLGARSSLPRHVGVEASVLRCHLGIVIPTDCGMRVGEQVVEWEEGRTIVFDDTIPHEAWNRSPDPKVILLIDFSPPWLRDDPTAGVLAQRKTDRDYYRAIFPEWA
jgi:beta-hydroxylase